MARGGDTIEITYNHPTLGTGAFFPKAGEAATVDLGGIRSADEAAGVDGAGNAIAQLSRVRWSYEVACANDMNGREDIVKAKQLAGSPEPATWTFANINGVIYTGTGWPVGDIQSDDFAATFTLKVSGGGELQKIS